MRRVGGLLAVVVLAAFGGWGLAAAHTSGEHDGAVSAELCPAQTEQLTEAGIVVDEYITGEGGCPTEAQVRRAVEAHADWTELEASMPPDDPSDGVEESERWRTGYGEDLRYLTDEEVAELEARRGEARER